MQVYIWMNRAYIYVTHSLGQSGTGAGFSAGSSVFPCQYHSTVALQTHIIWAMRNMLT
jgi:hypothetical protein